MNRLSHSADVQFTINQLHPAKRNRRNSVHLMIADDPERPIPATNDTSCTRPRASSLPAQQYPEDVILRAATKALCETNASLLNQGESHARVAILLCRKVLALPNISSTGHVSALRALNVSTRILGKKLLLACRHAVDEDQLQEALELLRFACATSSEFDFTGYVDALHSLADCLELHYEVYGDLLLLEECISVRRQIIALYPLEHPDRPNVASVLSMSLLRRYNSTRQAEDLNESLFLARGSLSVKLEGSPGRHLALYHLSSSLYLHWVAGGETKQLDEAIDLLRTAMGSCTELLAHILLTSALTKQLVHRFDYTKSAEDLQEAFTTSKRALVLTPEHCHLRLSLLSSYILCLLGKFNLNGNVSLLDNAIRLLQTILSSGRVLSRRVRSIFSGNLSTCLMKRFTLKGIGEDLDMACSIRLRNSEAEPQDYASRVVHQSNMVHGLIVRYEQHGSPTDIDDAISIVQAMNRSPLLTTERALAASVKTHLGAALELRFFERQSLRDLDEAVDLHRTAVQYLPSNNQRRRLAQALRLRFEHLHVRSDLDEAYYHVNHLVLFAAGDDLLRCEELMELAMVIYLRYVHCGHRPDELERANQVLQEALMLCPEHHILRYRVLIIESLFLFLPESPRRDEASALAFLYEAATDIYAGARQRLHALIDVLSQYPKGLPISKDNQPRMLKVYLSALALLRQVTSLGFDHREHISALHRAAQMTLDAALCGVQCQQLGTAIEALEQGRTIFWFQLLHLRTDFHMLPPEYRAEFAALIQSLNFGSSVLDNADTPLVLRESRAKIRRQQNGRLEELLYSIRQLPGLQRFYLGPSMENLSLVAQHGPVAILVATHASCFALLIMAGGSIEHVPFPRLNLEIINGYNDTLHSAVSELSRCRRRKLRGVEVDWSRLYRETKAGAIATLENLWNNAVSIVLSAFKIKASETKKLRPRLWWCPTGVFSFLPVHAAGFYGNVHQHGERCSDYVVSSYTPTLSALLRAREGFTALALPTAKALVVAAPIPFEDDWSDLPGARSEVQAVKSILPAEMTIPLSSAEDCATDASGARIGTVEDNVRAATILHLTSHGWQNPEDPLSSGFVMRDGILTVERLMKLSLPNAFLAFLSACDTAKGDQKQPDQAIHLAAAMLFIGFRSVVGTMWSIDDNDGVFVATEFYKKLMARPSEPLDADAVAFALDEAISVLQARDSHPVRWAAFIHLGI